MIGTQIRSFHAVALHGGYTAAAKAENVSQPTLSAQVKDLEERYGLELFHRVGRGVKLSLAGQELFALTSKLQHQMDEIDALLSAFVGLQKGSLRIAAVGPFHATDLIAVFKTLYPMVEVSVTFGNSQLSFERLIAYEADVGLIAEVNDDPRVTTLPYREHEVVVFVNETHPFYHRESISLNELAGQRVIRREKGSTTRIAVEKVLLERGVEIDVVLDIGSREGVWKAVEQGLGMGFVADFEYIPHTKMKVVHIHDATIRTRYFIAFLSERKDARLIKAFADMAIGSLHKGRR